MPFYLVKKLSKLRSSGFIRKRKTVMGEFDSFSIFLEHVKNNRESDLLNKDAIKAFFRDGPVSDEHLGQFISRLVRLEYLEVVSGTNELYRTNVNKIVNIVERDDIWNTKI